ncbi:MAG TPA: TonB-dependent receptor [Acidobacteriota bacterium]
MRTRCLALYVGTLLFAGAIPSIAAQEAPCPQDPAAPKGKIVGTVLDATNGMTLPTVSVEALGTGTVVHSDLDGKYVLELAPCTYEVRFLFSDYPEQVIRGVQLSAGQVITVDAVLDPATVAYEIEVSAELEPEQTSDAAQLLARRRAGVISDNVGADAIRKNADSDAAAVMERVTGVSVVGNQYVFVRGLGERYSNTVLNGSILPTTEPDKRVVPFDLFPAGLIENIQVVKSYTPDKPAEFAGGLVEIEPVSFPRQWTLNFSTSQGSNTETTFDTFMTYPGGDLDWLGFDDGTRSLPGVIPSEKVVRGSAASGRGFTPAALEAFGESFSNVWEPSGSDALQNQSYSLFFGNTWKRIGVVFSLSTSYKNQHQFEDQTYYGVSSDRLTVQNDYDFDISTTTARLGVVGNLSFRLTPNHTLALENFYSNKASNETRIFEGFNDDIRTQIRNTRLRWVEENIRSTKFSGEHFLPDFASSRFDWHVTHSRAQLDEPDLREVLYEFNPVRNAFVLADESQSGLRMFNQLDDTILEFGADWSLFFDQWQGLPALIKFGPLLVNRERDFSSRRFRFRPRNTIGVDLSLPPEQLFTPANIGPVFELTEETRNTDTYAANQDITAFYGMVDLPFSRKLRLVGGLRVERSDQVVDTFDPFNPDFVGVQAALDNTDLLPGLNLIYGLRDDMNLRFGYSRSVNRPEFRELAPFEFTDVVGGRAVVGNPDLRRALIANYDVRWEWFPDPTEVYAVSFFYKDFTDPIERIVEPTAQLRTSFTNALGARNAGLELELRKHLASGLDIAGNYALVDSQIELEATAGQVQTSLERPLAGQSRHLFNLMLEQRIEALDFGARLLYNYVGRRITDVGSLGLPDIYEEDNSFLDAVFDKNLWNQLGIRFSVENLTDHPYVFTQGGQPQRLFKLGRTYALSFSYAL